MCTTLCVQLSVLNSTTPVGLMEPVMLCFCARPGYSSYSSCCQPGLRRRRACHSAAPPSAFSRCTNSDGERERQHTGRTLANGQPLRPDQKKQSSVSNPAASEHVLAYSCSKDYP